MKKIFSFAFIMIAILLICGCKPKEDPSVVINSYYDNLKSSNYEGAYATLSSQTQKNYDKDEYLD